MKYLRSFLKESIDNIPIIDYSKSKSVILVGRKTNLFIDIFKIYQHKIDGDDVYFFQSDYHFATLFKQDSFYELRHDGSIDEKGRRIIDTGKLKREVDEWMYTITDDYQFDSSNDFIKIINLKKDIKEVFIVYKSIIVNDKNEYNLFFNIIIKLLKLIKRDLSLEALIFLNGELQYYKEDDIQKLSNKYNGEKISISFIKEI